MKDWKSKLTSRKFWSAVVGVIVALGAAFGADSMTIQQITAIITAAGVLVAYIFAESYVDAKRTGTGAQPSIEADSEEDQL